jgi:hypothetical protein
MLEIIRGNCQMKNSSSWTLRSKEGMPVSIPFIIVFQGHCSTLTLPTLFGSPYGDIVFLLSLSVIGISLAFVQICFLSSIHAASSFYSLVHVPSCIIRQCVFVSVSICNAMPPNSYLHYELLLVLFTVPCNINAYRLDSFAIF